jgi:hypothetical protein
MIPFVGFKEIEISLKKQLKNLQIKNKVEKLNPILDFFIGQVSDQVDDCELTMGQAELIVDQAKTGLELFRVQDNAAIDAQSRSMSLYLALVGIIFTIYQIFDSNIVAGIMRQFVIFKIDAQTHQFYWYDVAISKFMIAGTLVLLVWLIHRVRLLWVK